MTGSGTPEEPEHQGGNARGASGARNVFQLHVPLVVVLALCAAATVIEFHRANDGVTRAWIYTVQWPLIGAFAVWVWHRYRTEGNPAKRITHRWQSRIREMNEEWDQGRDEDQTPQASDPELDAWQEYVGELHRRDPPGSPPVD